MPKCSDKYTSATDLSLVDILKNTSNLVASQDGHCTSFFKVPFGKAWSGHQYTAARILPVEYHKEQSQLRVFTMETKHIVFSYNEIHVLQFAT